MFLGEVKWEGSEDGTLAKRLSHARVSYASATTCLSAILAPDPQSLLKELLHTFIACKDVSNLSSASLTFL
jgi:hypothetical protein